MLSRTRSHAPVQFQGRPHCMPVGRARQHMSDEQFSACAGPLLRQSEQHEQRVLGLFQKEVSPRIGGDQMRNLFQMRDTAAADGHGIARIHSDPVVRHREAARMCANSAAPAAVPRQPSSCCGGAPCYVPSVAIIGARPEVHWGTADPGAAQDAYAAAAAPHAAAQRVAENHRFRNRGSQVAFGSHELNPGLGGDDGYGVARRRSDIRPREAPRTLVLVDDARVQQPPGYYMASDETLKKNDHAGVTSQQTFEISDSARAEPPKRGPFAGRRQASVFNSGGDFVEPQQQLPGYYMAANQTLKRNDHAGKGAVSVMGEYLAQDPERHAAIVAQEHAGRMGRKHESALRASSVEETVFHHPLDPAFAAAHPPPEQGPGEGGKAAVHGVAASQTSVADTMYQRAAPPQQGRRGNRVGGEWMTHEEAGVCND